MGHAGESHQGFPRVRRLPGVAQAGRALLRLAAECRARHGSGAWLLARDPEKWEPVFGKDHAQGNNMPARILTTHTGSLPRTAKVVELLLAEDRAPGARAADLQAAVREAVSLVVHKQVEC